MTVLDNKELWNAAIRQSTSSSTYKITKINTAHCRESVQDRIVRIKEDYALLVQRREELSSTELFERLAKSSVYKMVLSFKRKAAGQTHCPRHHVNPERSPKQSTESEQQRHVGNCLKVPEPEDKATDKPKSIIILNRTIMWLPPSYASRPAPSLRPVLGTEVETTEYQDRGREIPARHEYWDNTEKEVGFKRGQTVTYSSATEEYPQEPDECDDNFPPSDIEVTVIGGQDAEAVVGWYDMTYLPQPTLKYPRVEKSRCQISDIDIARIAFVKTHLVWATTHYLWMDSQLLTGPESTIQKRKHGIDAEPNMATDHKSDSTRARSDHPATRRRKGRNHSPNLTPGLEMIPTLRMKCYSVSSGSREDSPRSSPHRSLQSHEQSRHADMTPDFTSYEEKQSAWVPLKPSKIVEMSYLILCHGTYNHHH